MWRTTAAAMCFVAVQLHAPGACTDSLAADVGDAGWRAKACAEISPHGVTNGNDVGRAQASTAEDCATACVAAERCCIAEYDANAGRCYLKYGGQVTCTHGCCSVVVAAAVVVFSVGHLPCTEHLYLPLPLPLPLWRGHAQSGRH